MSFNFKPPKGWEPGQVIRVRSIPKGPTRTKKAFAGECDINEIIRRSKVNGQLPPGRQGFYADVTDVPDYRGALEIVEYAREQFGMLPAKVRARFENDPGQMLAFLQDANNKEEAKSLGLLKDDAAAKPAGGQAPEAPKSSEGQPPNP